MSNKNKANLMPVLLSAPGVLLVGAVIYYLSAPANEVEAIIALKHKDVAVLDLGRAVYADNCASCHGVALEGQANWQQRDADGYLPAPPHDETGHTWSESNETLERQTKVIDTMTRIKCRLSSPAFVSSSDAQLPRTFRNFNGRQCDIRDYIFVPQG